MRGWPGTPGGEHTPRLACLVRPSNLPPGVQHDTDVEAFLASERGRNLSPEALKLRQVAIRHRHRAVICPTPASVTILRRLLAPIPNDILVGVRLIARRH